MSIIKMGLKGLLRPFISHPAAGELTEVRFDPGSFSRPARMREVTRKWKRSPSFGELSEHFPELKEGMKSQSHFRIKPNPPCKPSSVNKSLGRFLSLKGVRRRDERSVSTIGFGNTRLLPFLSYKSSLLKHRSIHSLLGKVS